MAGVNLLVFMISYARPINEQRQSEASESEQVISQRHRNPKCGQ